MVTLDCLGISMMVSWAGPSMMVRVRLPLMSVAWN